MHGTPAVVDLGDRSSGKTSLRRPSSADSYIEDTRLPGGLQKSTIRPAGFADRPLTNYSSALAALGYDFQPSDDISDMQSTIGDATLQPDSDDESSNARRSTNKDYMLEVPARQAEAPTAQSLFLRNVSTKSEVKASRLSRIIIGKHAYIVEREDEKHWQADLRKFRWHCEALFRYTVMMEAIDRHRLHEMLDFTCETEWVSPALPVNMDFGIDSEEITPLLNPRPDLAIAFKRRYFVDEDQLAKLGQDNLISFISPEAALFEGDGRAFPFLMIEAKIGRAHEADALQKAYHGASRALYNIWKFFELESSEHQKIFFSKIRVFSIIAHPERSVVLMHWATDANGPGREDRLFFRHSTIRVLQENSYTKQNLVGIIKNILEYGVYTLMDLLFDVVASKLRQAEGRVPPTPMMRRRSESHRKRASSPGASDQELSKRHTKKHHHTQ